MKKIGVVAVLSLLSGMTQAAFQHVQSEETRVYVCTLSPFQEIYADVAVSEAAARYRVQHRCERDKTVGSIFCAAEKARCHASSINLNTNEDLQRLRVYSQYDQRGATVSIKENQPDLTSLRFDDRIASFVIPLAWTVRFYEGKHYTGLSYTYQGGEANAIGFDNKISSLKILKRD